MKKKHSSAYLAYLNSSTWKQKSRWVRTLTRPFWLPRNARGQCCLFPWLPAQQTHHLTYYFIGKLGWDSFGFELPVWHIVPLSPLAHEVVGHRLLWRQPIRFFVNSYLRIAFIVLWTICKPMWSIPFWVGIYWLWVNWLSDKVMPLVDFVRGLF